MAVSSAPASSLSSHDPSITYDTIDFNDRKQVVAARNTMIREQWIKTMEQRLVRDELARCYKSEGVNHYVTCKHLADRYMAMLKEHRHVTGYMFQERTDPNA